MVNVEALIVGHLNSALGSGTAFADIPEERPERFITVERVGGPETLHLGRPVLAIQCWESTRHKASEFSVQVADLIKGMAGLPQVGRAAISSVYNFPDPDSRQARYQMTVEMVVKN